MFLNANITSALDRITERAADVRRAFSSGAFPQRDDVASAKPAAFVFDPLSVVAPQGAFFAIADGAGTGYTRDGSFTLTRGVLTDRAGRAVFGVQRPGDALSELRIDPVDFALDRAGDVRIEADGSLTYTRKTIDPRTGAAIPQRVVAGRVALARFPAATKLETRDGVTFAPADVIAHTGSPGKDGFGALLPMRREPSHVDLDESLARLKAAYVAFDAIAAAETTKGHFGKTAMDLLK